MGDSNQHSEVLNGQELEKLFHDPKACGTDEHSALQVIEECHGGAGATIYAALADIVVIRSGAETVNHHSNGSPY